MAAQSSKENTKAEIISPPFKLVNVILPTVFIFIILIFTTYNQISILPTILAALSIIVFFIAFLYYRKIIYCSDNNSLEFISMFGKRKVNVVDIEMYKFGRKIGEPSYLSLDLIGKDNKIIYSFRLHILEEEKIEDLFSRVLKLPQKK